MGGGHRELEEDKTEASFDTTQHCCFCLATLT